MQVEIYSPPWREIQSDGSLGRPYGPSPSTYARHMQDYRLWSFDRRKLPSKQARRLGDMAAMRAWMRPDGGELREDVPQREREVYLHVYEHGHAVRWVARHMRVSRASVRTYLRRLHIRLDAAGGNGPR